MKDLNFKVAHPQTLMSDDTFVNPNHTTSSVEKSKNGDIIDGVINLAKNTKDMLVDETKTIAPEVVDTFKDSKRRLDSEKRLIKAIPNSYLYYGIVLVAGYFIVKRL